MRRLLVTLGAALVALGIVSAPALAGAGCHNPAPTNSEGTGSAVEIRNCGFNPVVLFVELGTTVSWKHADGPPHNVVGVGWGNANPFGQGGAVSHTFSDPGIYPYQCSFHPGMAGAIVVGDSASVRKEAAARVAGASAAEPSSTTAEPNVALGAATILAAAIGGILIGRRLAR